MNISLKNKDFWFVVSLCAASFILVLFNTALSPFYAPSYITHDASVFYVMGRAMKEGLVPYKDLFDHKGLYIYFIYYIAALIGEKHLIGLFICFSVLASILSIFAYKLIRLFCEPLISFFSTFLFTILSTSMMYCHNAILCEYPALICITISIYLLTKCIKFDKEFNPIYMLVNGVLFSICLFTKANYCLYYVSVIIYILYDFVINKRKTILLFKYFIYGVLGIIIGAMPVIIYCVLHDCLKDMFFCVFTFNFRYASAMNIDLPEEVDTKFKAMLYALQSYRNSVLACVCSFVILLYKKVDKKIIIFFVISFIIMLFSIIFPGTGYTHYASLLLPYFIPFIIVLISGFLNFFANKNKIYKVISIVLLTISLFLISFIAGKQILDINFSYSTNQFAKIKKEINKYVPLNTKTKFISAGLGSSLYNFLGVVPRFKYYYIPSMSYDLYKEPADELCKYILSGTPDVVFYADNLVIDGYSFIMRDYLKENYYRLEGNFDVEYYPIYIKRSIIDERED